MANKSAEQTEKFPVREGTGENTNEFEKAPPQDNRYPKPELKDVQANNQPEFTEEQPNNKSPNNSNNAKP